MTRAARLLLLTAALGSLAPAARAERIMDSVDALTSALSATQTQLERGDFKNLLANAQKAAQLAQDRFGPLHPSVAPYFDNLGVVEETLAHYPEAETHFEWSLALREKAGGPDDPALAPALVSLAFLDGQLGRFEEAQVDIQRALALIEAAPDKPGLVGALQLAGDLQYQAGHPDLAAGFWTRALAERPDPGVRVALLARLGSAEGSQGQLSQARASFQEALRTAQRSFAPDDIRIADRLKDLGDLDLRSGRGDEGKELLEKALAMDLRFIGPEDTYANLPYHQRGADAYYSLGQWSQADALYRRILSIKTGVYGPAHPELALTLEDLARTAEKLGDRPGAKKDLADALAILTRYFPDSHPLVVDLKARQAALR
ncbi:MAG TPA: tetratricopeptide repeat protein [bacterium]|nr:tetratricopeptide repeat protein [bacterium]